ncbi:hypothetical protein VP01_496g6 [Puccinia sorghi]|uniref:Uncharacterized protein n=1 Tax=Puccinia sorghi TaxID=27349 RepID=A0A0L6UMM5_9BASI|nr:hypothetical protein VP01_496g6 [Puccinia sorghi]
MIKFTPICVLKIGSATHLDQRSNFLWVAVPKRKGIVIEIQLKFIKTLSSKTLGFWKQNLKFPHRFDLPPLNFMEIKIHLGQKITITIFTLKLVVNAEYPVTCIIAHIFDLKIFKIKIYTQPFKIIYWSSMGLHAMFEGIDSFPHPFWVYRLFGEYLKVRWQLWVSEVASVEGLQRITYGKAGVIRVFGGSRRNWRRFFPEKGFGVWVAEGLRIYVETGANESEWCCRGWKSMVAGCGKVVRISGEFVIVGVEALVSIYHLSVQNIQNLFTGCTERSGEKGVFIDRVKEFQITTLQKTCSTSCTLMNGHCEDCTMTIPKYLHIQTDGFLMEAWLDCFVCQLQAFFFQCVTWAYELTIELPTFHQLCIEILDNISILLETVLKGNSIALIPPQSHTISSTWPDYFKLLVNQYSYQPVHGLNYTPSWISTCSGNPRLQWEWGFCHPDCEVADGWPLNGIESHRSSAPCDMKSREKVFDGFAGLKVIWCILRISETASIILELSSLDEQDYVGQINSVTGVSALTLTIQRVFDMQPTGFEGSTHQTSPKCQIWVATSKPMRQGWVQCIVVILIFFPNFQQFKTKWDKLFQDQSMITCPQVLIDWSWCHNREIYYI